MEKVEKKKFANWQIWFKAVYRRNRKCAIWKLHEKKCLFVLSTSKIAHVKLPGAVWEIYIKLAVLQMPQNNINFTLQSVLRTCHCYEIYWGENCFFLYNLTNLQPTLEYFPFSGEVLQSIPWKHYCRGWENLKFRAWILHINLYKRL